MNRLNLLLTFFLLWSLVPLQAQLTNFTDDFESYDDGDFIAASSSRWTTWSGGTPAEDTKVTTEQAYSGTKSLKFQGTPGGGPADIILPFGAKATDGAMIFSFQLYVPAGKNAYFNFQRETSPGVAWTEEVFFNEDGSITGTNLPFTGHFNHDAWNKVVFGADFSANEWFVYVNGQYVGGFSHPVNAAASVDIFPVNADAVFYIDDVNLVFFQPPLTYEPLNAILQYVKSSDKVLAGQPYDFDLYFRNYGQQDINSIVFQISDGTNSWTQSVSGLNLAPQAETHVQLDSVAGSIPAGITNVSFEIVSVNGMTDDTTGNKINFSITAVEPAPHRKVLIEEGTGTWCQWCPRGAIFMEQMGNLYPQHFVGIAVHAGNDPMAMDSYASQIGYAGFPQMADDRHAPFDIGVLYDVQSRFFNDIVKVPPAKVHCGAKIINDTTLAVTAQADFLEDATQQYKLAVVLVEDSVTGTGSGYAQANAYSGGANGPMGGYENLPDPVPASQMVYNHVARALISPFNGLTNGLPADAMQGQAYVVPMPDYTLPASFDTSQLKLVTILLDANNKVANVNEQSLAEALSFVVGNEAIALPQDRATLYPNPATDRTAVFIRTSGTTTAAVRVYNTLGQAVLSRNLGQIHDAARVDLDVSRLPQGIYHVEIRLGSRMLTRKLLVQ